MMNRFLRAPAGRDPSTFRRAHAIDAAPTGRLVVVPGLRGSEAAHWQTWLERQFDGASRAEQDDWNTPDLLRWSRRVAETVDGLGPGRHVLVAHSFGCLATAHALQAGGLASIARVLLVAPAEPAKFGIAAELPQRPLRCPSTLVASETDPWMSLASARAWATRWGCAWINLGDAGHVNVASGFGPFGLARAWVEAALSDVPDTGDPGHREWRAAA